MEKHTPHCKLSVVKALVAEGRVRATHSSHLQARKLGIDEMGMRNIVLALTPADFYKSMTTHADHKIWQDVYRPNTHAGSIYLKLTVTDLVLIVSFKER
jgi:motility quorum-sensing regulator/GCU-specific mRNA interferase toxin